MMRKQNPKKLNQNNVSDLVKQKLWHMYGYWHMDAYDGATNEQQIELLKKTWNLSFMNECLIDKH